VGFALIYMDRGTEVTQVAGAIRFAKPPNDNGGVKCELK
jgi:hypothetical protein